MPIENSSGFKSSIQKIKLLFCSVSVSLHIMTQDELYMKRCLQLAENGRGSVAPNPMVGAILVYDKRILAEGWTQPYGNAHAEVHCLQQVSIQDQVFVSESTLFVSLEPCTHFGKTPPCVDLIIARKIKKVVLGCKDVAAHVNGKGIQKLKHAGVEVVVGVLESECIAVNKRFFFFQLTKRPYIILKWAQSADGFLSTQGKRTKITSTEIDVIVHKWRTEEAAIMVGTNTALLDNPELTARLWQGKQPTRIVIDKKLSIESSSFLYNDEAPTIFLNEKFEGEKGQHKFLKIEADETGFLKRSLKRLAAIGVLSILVEGGAQLLNSFIEQNLWYEARIITNMELNLAEGLPVPLCPNGILIQKIETANHSINFYQNN